jgi:hypothetical protein
MKVDVEEYIQNQIRSNVGLARVPQTINFYIRDNLLNDDPYNNANYNFNYYEVAFKVDDPVRQALRNTMRNMFDYMGV